MALANVAAYIFEVREAPKYYPLIAYHPLLEILLCAFNAILFGLLSFYCIRDYRRRKTKWGGYIYAYIVVLCAVLFGFHLANDFSSEFAYRRYYVFDIFEIASKYLIPPLMLHLFYRNEKEHLKPRRVWMASVVVLYAIGVLFATAEVNVGVIGGSQWWPGWGIVRVLFRVLMTLAATGCLLALWTSRPANATPVAAKQRRWLIYVCCTWIITFLMAMMLPENVSIVVEKIIPLLFVFVVTYYVERFAFFDVLIKKGVFVFTSLFLLVLYFVVVPPLLLALHFRTWVGTLIWALSAWPIALFAPWGHRKVSSWVDRHLLGRRFTSAEATKYFLSGLQGALDEKELAREAEAHLCTIFRSQVRVHLGPPPDAAVDSTITAIRLGSEKAGEIHVEHREHLRRFLSEDAALLSSLADGLAFLLENIRLREKRLEQEKRERELRSNANLSELKALRAQINPHFLFNALNTIASLIPRHPDRAEETVEELAEVFRYTLSRSDREWVQLEEELEAVRAYLRIEQARFGEHLSFEIHAGNGIANIRIPAMVVQTLVENSIKHGIAQITVPGVVEVRVDVSQSSLRIEVRDNGRGFERSSFRDNSTRGSGYGLRNVEERLRRYFGAEASINTGRDLERDMTLVSVRMPRVSRAMGATTV